MRNGICPKCNSATVYAKKKGAGFEGGLFIYTSAMTTSSQYMSYICTTCGYFENYIDNEDKLRQVAEKWDAVPPSKP